MDLNRVFLIGNLTRDPESRMIPSGAQVTKFDIAVNERRGNSENTMFIRIEAWGKTGELCQQYLQKGAEVLVDGRLRIDEYETKDGQKRRDPVITAERVSFGRKPRGAEGGDSYGGGRNDDYQRGGSAPQRARETRNEYDEPRREAAPPSSSNDTQDDLPF